MQIMCNDMCTIHTCITNFAFIMIYTLCQRLIEILYILTVNSLLKPTFVKPEITVFKTLRCYTLAKNFTQEFYDVLALIKAFCRY